MFTNKGVFDGAKSIFD